MTTKLIILADNVKDKNCIIQSLLPDVSYIELGSKDTVTIFQEKIASLDLHNLTNIGIVYDNTAWRAPFVEYTEEELKEEEALKCNTHITPPISDNSLTNNISSATQIQSEAQSLYDTPPSTCVEYIDNSGIIPAFHKTTNYFSDGFLTVINEIKSASTLNTIDVISCNTKENQQFNELLENGIIVRYSTNITGNGGDWILESHNVNVTPVYFTDAISSYPYRLGAVAPTTQDGSGNWEINNADNLYWLMTFTSNTGVAPNLSSPFIIKQDIDMQNVIGGPITYPTQSIGKAPGGGRFIGRLEGNNTTVTIRNIDFTNPAIAGQGFMGFFGWFGTDSGTIATGYVGNLTIRYTINSFTFGTSGTPITTSQNLYGLLCGIATSGTIENCKVEFNNSNPITISYVSGTGATSINEVGGLIGRRILQTVVQNCSLNITGNFIIQVSSFSNCTVGGIVGTSSVNGTVNNIGFFNINCNIGGDLTIQSVVNNNTPANAISIIGGFMGTIQNSVTSPPTQTTDILYCNFCNLTCNNLSINDNLTQPVVITGNINQIGGFCGSIIGNVTMSDCTITTNNLIIDFEQFTNKRIGGFIGSNRRITNLQRAFISNCTLNVTNLSIIVTNTNINFLSQIGGFLGYNQSSGAEMSSCQVNIKSLLIETSSNVVGVLLLGGILGLMEAGSISSNNIINIESITVDSNDTATLAELSIGGYTGVMNASNITNCVTTIGQFNIENNVNASTSQVGGMVGNVVNSSNINTNTLTVTNINVKIKGNTTRVGGAIGVLTGTSIFQNCTINIGDGSYIESVTTSTTVSMGCMIGFFTSSGSVQNNIITYGNYLTLKANQNSTTINLNSTVGQGNVLGSSNIIYFGPYALIFNSISNGTGITIDNGQSYYIEPQKYTIRVGNNYNIDLSDITLFFYLIPRVIEEVQNCCNANVCNPNPVVANYDNRNVVANKGGQTLVGAVDNFYRAAANNQLRPNAPPMFKSYQQMMDWLQRQNRR
jgi:hypothetical protein